MNSEPEDFCRSCDEFFPLSELRKHVASGCKKRRRKSVGVTSSKCVRAIDLYNDDYAQ